MLLQINPATPPLFTFLCPQTLAAAVIDVDNCVAHPVTTDHFGKFDRPLLDQAAEAMEEISQSPFFPEFDTKHTPILPEWMRFVTTKNTGQRIRTFILHTTAPVFLSPIPPDGTVLSPIADSPAIPAANLPTWIAKAQHHSDRIATDLMAALAEG